MTNSLDMLPPVCSPSQQGGDVLPLLVVISVFGGVYLLARWLRQRRRNRAPASAGKSRPPAAGSP